MYMYVCVCMYVCAYISFLMVFPLPGILLPTGRRPCLFRSGLSIHQVKKPLLALQGRLTSVSLYSPCVCAC